MLIKGKDFYVLGLGRSGLAAAHFLDEAGAKVSVWDDGIKTADKFLYAPPSEYNWSVCSGLVLSPGISWRWPVIHPAVLQARAAGVPILSDIDLFALTVSPDAQTIAVTGTNGKSTTAALIHYVLCACGFSAAIGGNFGISPLELEKDCQFYVLELSSYQIDITHSFFPHVAVLLNISPDHLDRYGGMSGYIASKQSILEGVPGGSKAVMGVDDVYTQEIYQKLSRFPNLVPVSVTHSLERGVFLQGSHLMDTTEGVVLDLGDISESKSLEGKHNIQNMLAAYAALRPFIPGEQIISAIKNFSGLPHRQEKVGTLGSIDFINDSKATNPESVATAMEVFENIFWILGGKAKDNELAGLDVYKSKIKKAFLIGQASDRFGEILTEYHIDHVSCGELGQALLAAYQEAVSFGQKATVLLSPACASFDQYKSFEARGEHFRSLVTSLLKEVSK